MTREEYLNKVELAIERGAGAEHLPVSAPVVAMFARNYIPVDPPAASGDNMTSREIVELLEDTCSLSVTDVAVVMAYLGFRLHVNNYRGHEWAMCAVTPV